MILTALFLLAYGISYKNRPTEDVKEEKMVIEPSPTPNGAENASGEVTEKATEDNFGYVSYYIASYDGLNCSNPECRMANSKPFDENAFTTACPQTFKFGTIFKVSYNGSSVVAPCTDRGGFEKLGRKLDLSKAAFEQLAPLTTGIIYAKIEVIDQ